MESCVVKCGPLRKLKSMKKKYFVLSGGCWPRLEYYDTEKKWRCGGAAKRSVPLRSCFDIARRLDTKHKHVLALYTAEDCLCMVMESDDELRAWLQPLVQMLHGEPQLNANARRHHVWQVNAQKRGLGASRNILGLYHLCLTDRLISLVKIKTNNHHHVTDSIDFPLMTVRTCGDSECFFYMEVGRSAATGAGELWFHTEDPNIAKSMHATILNAMSSGSKDEMAPQSRNRSSSANEASKPTSVPNRRQTHTGSKASHGLSPSSGESTFCGGRNCVGLCINSCATAASAAYAAPQDAADKPPSVAHADIKPPPPPDDTINDIDVNNGHHVVAGGDRRAVTLNVAHERTRSLPLTGEETTDVRISKDLQGLIERKSSSPNNNVKRGDATAGLTASVAPCNKTSQKCHTWGRRASTGCRVVKWLPSSQAAAAAAAARSGSIGSIVGVRERCDSLPSRANAAVITPRLNPNPLGSSRLSTVLRPHSMFVHGIGQSPPIVTNSPLSPNSGACSTDSAGSSLSIDEADSFIHGMMPDEKNNHGCSRIPEEGTDETLIGWQPNKPFNEFLDPSSPVPIVGVSPKDNEYTLMSPASTEPLKLPHSYNSNNSASHSRTSSLAEEAESTPDINLLHPPIKPDDGYVDMEPAKKHTGHAMSPAGSISSVTSGTPSTHLPFSEFHLDKVSSYFTPSEEDDGNRPARAYSVGSRPDPIKKIINRPEVSHNVTGAIDPSRTRAFSVGSHNKPRENRKLNFGTPPHQHLHHLLGSTHVSNKSSSAPILAAVSTPRHYGDSRHEPDDLMEMDFTSGAPRFTQSFNTDPIQHSMSMHSSLGSSSSKMNKNVSEGYLYMSPINSANTGYIEMKPAEPTSSGSSTPKATGVISRKASVSKSPPLNSSQELIQDSSACYVDMNLNSKKGNSSTSQIFNRISSSPITINNSSKKEKHGSSITALTNPSPNFSPVSKCDQHLDTKTNKKSSKVSSGISSVIPNPLSSIRKRSLKHQTRKNSKEFISHASDSTHSNLSPLNINNTTLTNSSNSSKSEIASDNLAEKKYPLEMLKSLSLSYDPSNSIDCEEEPISDYMEMNLSKLTTVNEMSVVELNKLGVDKDIKQLINNATKVLDSNVSTDYSDYISLNPNVTIDNKCLWSERQKSIVESPLEGNEQKDKCDYGQQNICGSRNINVFRKSALPAFSDNYYNRCSDVNLDFRENQDILSSNPLANKSLMSNPSLMKTNITNQSQNIKKTIVVKVTGQSQPFTANFKPIPSSELSSDARSSKSGSPKLNESGVNRSLNDGGYEILSSQNGQPSERQMTSRPGSVNKIKKGNGCSGSRPPSVTSQGEVSRSRPSSVSSEMSNTPTNSRPASVMGENVSRGLHYASLELDTSDRSPRPPPTPNTNQSAFSYAQIDFIKSEELKNSKNISSKGKN